MKTIKQQHNQKVKIQLSEGQFVDLSNVEIRLCARTSNASLHVFLLVIFLRKDMYVCMCKTVGCITFYLVQDTTESQQTGQCSRI